MRIVSIPSICLAVYAQHPTKNGALYFWTGVVKHFSVFELLFNDFLKILDFVFREANEIVTQIDGTGRMHIRTYIVFVELIKVS